MIIIVIAVALLGVGVFMYLSTANKADSILSEEEVMLDEPTLIEEATEAEVIENAAYIEYSTNVLKQAAEGRRILFFYASWCPTCIPADADFKANAAQIPQNITVVRVNYNDPDTDQEEKDLAKKYGITYQHIFVEIDSEGKEVTKWNGGGLDELIQKTSK